MRYEKKVALSKGYGRFKPTPAFRIPQGIIAGPNRDRQFGHVDKVSADHHGPETRWKKQERRRRNRRANRVSGRKVVEDKAGNI